MCKLNNNQTEGRGGEHPLGFFFFFVNIVKNKKQKKNWKKEITELNQ